MKPNECIFFQLAKTSRKGIQFLNRNLEALKLTSVQGMVINSLGEADNIRFNQLGEKLNLTSATLTGIVDRLEKSGFVKRQPNPEDRRSILIALTAAGKKILPEIRSIIASANMAFLDSFKPEEEAMIRGLLNRINQQQEQISGS